MKTADRNRGWLVALVAAAALLLVGCAPSLQATPSAPTPASSQAADQPDAGAEGVDAAPVGQLVQPAPSFTPKPKPTAGPPLMQRGATGDEVKDLQARLKQIGWFSSPVSGNYDDTTVEAVRGFQAKRDLAVTGAVDRATLDRVNAMTRKPTEAELNNTPPKPSTETSNGLDPRCLTGRTMCIDKTTSKLVWVIDGSPQMTMDVRFGSELTPTREGQFSVGWKSRDHVSTLYHTSMPFAMFFSGGQAVHYSPDFAARGYNGSSHGCVNVRDYNAVKSLFDQARTGDKVIVYRS